jgi:hypothetical protein
MKKNIYYGVFTYTDSGKDYLVKANFGPNEDIATAWADENSENYKHGLFVKSIKII